MGLACTGLVMIFQSAPGYMDADYSFAGGLRLVSGEGFTELWLWNYLDDPQGLPHPSHLYWMPLSSILSALSMLLFQQTNYGAARILFWIISGFLPLLTAKITYEIDEDIHKAWLGGFLAVFSSFYLAYLPVTDTFGPSMLLGGMWFLAIIRLRKQPIKQEAWKLWNLIGFLLGLIAGGFHLLRVEGFIWLLFSFLAILTIYSKNRNINKKWLVGQTGLLFLGYLSIMLPWFAHNFQIHQSIFGSGGNHALWITSYDELFHYPASDINSQAWVRSGMNGIIQARIWSLGQNLQTLFAIQGGIFLFPLIILGNYRKRGNLEIQFLILIWSIFFFVMTIIFPFQGARGGFFHAGAALQPMIWATVPVGLAVFIEWGIRTRDWALKKAWRLFSFMIIVLSAIITLVIGFKRVVGNDPSNPAWNHSYHRYQHVEQILEGIDPSKEQIVMVNNPPGYYIASSRPAIVIPSDNEETVMAVAKRYEAKFLLLEMNIPTLIEHLFSNPHDRVELDYLQTVEGTVIYLINR